MKPVPHPQISLQRIDPYPQLVAFHDDGAQPDPADRG